MVKFPESLEIVELDPAIDNLDVGLVVPIPIFPLLEIYKAEVNPASPPGDIWKLRVLLLRRLKRFAPAVVGTAMERFPEMVAVGDPPATLMKPNLADVVEVAPMRRSIVELPG